MDLMKLFQAYHWPGNVRELSNIILRLMLVDSPEKIKAELIHEMRLDGHPSAMSFTANGYSEHKQNESNSDVRRSITALKGLKEEASKYIQRRLILHVLNKADWNRRKAAEMLQISYRTLLYKMQDHGINNNGNKYANEIACRLQGGSEPTR